MASEHNTRQTHGRTRQMRVSRRKRLLLIGAAMASAAVSALVVPGATAVASADPTPGLHEVGEPTPGLHNVGLKVLSPTPGQVVTGPTLPITVYAKGYKLDSFYAGTAVSNHIGHYHEILDGHLVDMAPLHDPNHDAISMVGVTPGQHTLTLVPANNNHMTVASAAVNIPFTYAGPYLPEPAGLSGTPGVAITAPANGATVSGDSFTMTADVTNFASRGDTFGKANVAGQGHWHIFVDAPVMSSMLTMASDASQEVPIKGVPTGWHTFWAVLVGNDHMPIMPMTMTSVHLYVTHPTQHD
jgi:hypothetical protein